MRNSTSRALRATATVAGVAALGATFVGTAFADSGLGGLGGSDNGYGSSDSHGLNDFGNSEGSSIIDEPGLANFEMPGIGMGSKGMSTRSDFGGFGDFGDDNDDDYGSGRDSDCGDDDRDSRSGDRNGFDQFQNPVQCKDNGILKSLNFNGDNLGGGRHDWNSSYKSIGSRDFRSSDDSDFGDIIGGHSESDSDFSDSDYGNKIYGHGGSSSRNGGDDSDFGGSGDGLSGHTIKLPLGT